MTATAIAPGVGEPAPEFDGETTGGRFSLAAHRGSVVVLYFYPKDSTPGCTTETREFADAYPSFVEAGAVVVGLSRDSLKSHHRFKDALGLPFELISDPDETICQAYGVMKLKNMYGKQVRGIERSTFVVDRAGRVAHGWRGVKVPGHVDEVLAAVRAL